MHGEYLGRGHFCFMVIVPLVERVSFSEECKTCLPLLPDMPCLLLFRQHKATTRVPRPPLFPTAKHLHNTEPGCNRSSMYLRCKTRQDGPFVTGQRPRNWTRTVQTPARASAKNTRSPLGRSRAQSCSSSEVRLPGSPRLKTQHSMTTLLHSYLSRAP